MESCKCHESKLNERKQSNNEKHDKNENVEDVEKRQVFFVQMSRNQEDDNW